MLQHKNERSSYAYSGVMFSEEIVSILKHNVLADCLKVFCLYLCFANHIPTGHISDISLGIKRNARF